MSKPKIGVIISSTRDTRFADKPANWFMDQVKDNADLDFQLLDLRDFDLPFFNEKASNAWVPSEDAAAVKWQKALAECDGFVVVMAEYNRSITGALKNAFDQAYTEWNRKPIGAVAYGSMGGAFALQHLRNIATELQMVPVRSSVHIGGSDFFTVSPLGAGKDMSAIEGNLKNSLKGLVDDLTWWTKATKAARG